MVASMTIVFAQAKPRDLQIELKKFFSDKGVWDTCPMIISEVRTYEFNFVIYVPIGSVVEKFNVPKEWNKDMVKFESEYYKRMNPALPMVTGAIVYLKPRYSNKVYFAIINDYDIIEKNIDYNIEDGMIGAADGTSKKNYYQKLDFNVNSKLEGAGTNLPMRTFKDAKGNEGYVAPNLNQLIQVFEVANPSQNFMEAHRGQEILETRLAVLDKTQENAVKIIKEFPNDYLYPVGVTFVFNDKKKESYQVYKTASGNTVFASLDFFFDWQP